MHESSMNAQNNVLSPPIMPLTISSNSLKALILNNLMRRVILTRRAILITVILFRSLEPILHSPRAVRITTARSTTAVDTTTKSNRFHFQSQPKKWLNSPWRQTFTKSSTTKNAVKRTSNMLQEADSEYMSWLRPMASALRNITHATSNSNHHLLSLTPPTEFWLMCCWVTCVSFAMMFMAVSCTHAVQISWAMVNVVSLTSPRLFPRSMRLKHS
mmetsp:Transcript_33250/g.91631  ORF Transcript_33250/g.91631 Transcript_33250/m.91631 type:complete len:215 (-) Transcript_33250:151-795(-)